MLELRRGSSVLGVGVGRAPKSDTTQATAVSRGSTNSGQGGHPNRRAKQGGLPQHCILDEGWWCRMAWCMPTMCTQSALTSHVLCKATRFQRRGWGVLVGSDGRPTYSDKGLQRGLGPVPQRGGSVVFRCGEACERMLANIRTRINTNTKPCLIFPTCQPNQAPKPANHIHSLSMTD